MSSKPFTLDFVSRLPDKEREVFTRKSRFLEAVKEWTDLETRRLALLAELKTVEVRTSELSKLYPELNFLAGNLKNKRPKTEKDARKVSEREQAVESKRKEGPKAPKKKAENPSSPSSRSKKHKTPEESQESENLEDQMAVAAINSQEPT